jgi:hypothetical protein
MGSWEKVVTHPLGLAGFALFLFFSFVGKARQKKRPAWHAPAAFAMAATALAGGLLLSYLQSSSKPTPTSNQRIGQIKQDAGGGSGSNVAGVQGNVTVTTGQAGAKGNLSSAPLSADDITALLIDRQSNESVVAEIERRGIGFRLTPTLMEQFRQAGASTPVLHALSGTQKK